MRAFVSGATLPSPTAAAAMLVTMALLVALCCVVVTPARIAGGMWRLLAHPGDDAAWFEATARWLDLRQTPPRSPAVLVVGSSAIDEALDVALCETELRRRLGREPDLRALLMRGVSVWEMAALVDLVPGSTEGVIALGVGLGVLAPPRGLRAGVLLPVGQFERELRKRFKVGVGEPTGIYFLDRFRVLAPRIPHLVRQLVAPSPARPRARFRRLDELDDDGAAIGSVPDQLTLAEELTRNAAVLTAVVRQLVARGSLRVVLVEQPIDRERAHGWLPPGTAEAYRGAVDAVVAATGVPEIRPGVTAGLVSADFLDLHHLDPAGTGPERFTSALARDLGAVLQASPEAAQ